ncbi:MAG TPA: glycosyltransferase family 2 protein [Dehalococcoidia bacterium]|jgi:glycosyltransferase involved in cell wall biosynthesis|nr:glycosyltransferase family 2 protein [Dehalococcoidia bacterium]|tara:strand:- start:3834 stop:4580 length:747 start_codon:yes stop_codon:yes gene_type:complete
MKKTLDVVIPVLNEARALADSVNALAAFLSNNLNDYEWAVVVADNGSTDATPSICQSLSEQDSRVRHVRLEQRGRGRALKRAWAESNADIVAYMDVDLSTDLSALPQTIAAVDGEGYDIAIGSRLKRGAQVMGRSFKRELISRSYSLIFRAMFLAGFQDAQCGFKAVSRRAADDVAPLVVDNGWFFDTEMLLIAEKNGYRIKEIPVKWTDDPDSRVKIISTAWEDIKGLLRLRFGGLRQASREIARNR